MMKNPRAVLGSVLISLVGFGLTPTGWAEAQGPQTNLMARVQALEATVAAQAARIAALEASLAAEVAARQATDAAVAAEAAARQAADTALQVNAFSDFQAAAIYTSGSLFVTLAKVALAAGKYVIHAKASALEFSGTDAKLPYCTLSALDGGGGSLGTIDVSQALFPTSVVHNERVTLSLLSRFEFEGDGSIWLSCANNLGYLEGNVVKFQNGVLSAIKVAELE